MMRMLRPLDRRQVPAGGIAAGIGFAAPAIAQARTRVRLGYLHVIAVDGQVFTGLDRGSFDKQGIDFEPVERNTGPEVFEAVARGEVDVLSAGGVLSNYLALGAGRAFLINDIEIATAQLWVRPDHGAHLSRPRLARQWPWPCRRSGGLQQHVAGGGGFHCRGGACRRAVGAV
jgi:NitT/TauT family transport system substrate-binding protein